MKGYAKIYTQNESQRIDGNNEPKCARTGKSRMIRLQRQIEKDGLYIQQSSVRIMLWFIGVPIR